MTTTEAPDRIDDARRHFSKSELESRLSIHRNTAMKLLQRGEFPNAFKLGRDWRIPESDYQAYLDRRRQASGARSASE